MWDCFVQVWQNNGRNQKKTLKYFYFIWMFSHSLLDNEYFFVDPDLKLTKVAPDGWKEEPKKKSKATVNFTLFFRIKFFMDDVSLIQWVHKGFCFPLFGPWSFDPLVYWYWIIWFWSMTVSFFVIKEILPSTYFIKFSCLKRLVINHLGN